MSAPQDLNELYTGELQDLWSANDQMAKVIKKMTSKASDPKLKEMLTKSQDGIAQHTEMLKGLLETSGEKVKKEHCKGMEGLVAEATKHTGDEAPDNGPVLDAVIIAQYQRMSHYGIAGFGTAASFAGTLGLKDAVKALDKATKDIYSGDEYLTKLAEMSVNINAQ
ncbi:YciE/YciF ferroxidase family protein [Sandarakinorhabdus sp.]|uniref:YciE/YciF ferroxidase family protein n=1 Tax=Sandarakinorhabdus sp. TaxID=1916663 RepID=UPI003F6F260C